MEDIIITSKDYKDFNVKLSDLNIINAASGEEYLVDASKISNLDINADSMINKNGEISPTYPDSLVVQRVDSVKITKVMYDAYLRKELGYIAGYVTATTSQVLNSVDDISIGVSIDYDSYKKRDDTFLNEGNYQSSESLFKSIMDPAYQQNISNGERTPQTVENSMPNKPSTIKIYILGFMQVNYKEYNLDSIQLIQKPRIVSVSDKGTTITFGFRILAWNGYTHLMAYGFDYDVNLLLDVAKKITFTIQANTISTTANDFSYIKSNTQSFQTDSPYNLDSNELMQYQAGEDEKDRLSYQTVQKIFEKTGKNRIICSFDLLNVDKYDFDTAVNSGYRYLDCGDKIKIKDESDNFLGQYTDADGNIVIPYFEIIKMENKWDGTYHKVITCKQVSST